VSIVTTSFNSAKTIDNTLHSVASQTYDNIEHIVIDGGSTDETVDIVNQFDHVEEVISEKDKGIYDAMNKGIRIATGDIVGTLNSDDWYTTDDVIQKVSEAFQDQSIDAVIGDVAFVKSLADNRISRYYSSQKWHIGKLKYGWMPAHPTLFLRKQIYERYGVYKTDYQVAADFELIARMFYVNRIRYKYVPIQMVTMLEGGVSNKNIKSRWITSKEIVRACAENEIQTNMYLLALKYPQKLLEYIN